MDPYAQQLSLIGDKASQLRECPTMQRGALRPSSPHPRSDMRQILQRNRPLRAFHLRHDLLTQIVIDPCSKPPFLSRKRTQAAAAAQRSFLLQLLAQPPMAIAHVLDRFRLMDNTIGIGCDVGHTQINTYGVGYRLWFLWHNFRRGEQIPLATNEHKITFANAVGQQRALVFAANERNRLASLNCPDRDSISLVGKNAIIKGNRAKWLEGAFGFPIQLVGVRNFGNAAHHKLSRQTKCFFGVVVRQLVNAELLELACIPGDIAYRVTSSVGTFKCLAQQRGLL